MIGATKGIEKEVSVTGTVNQYTLATAAGTDNNTYEMASGPTAAIIGVFQFAPSTDQPQARVMLTGVSLVKINSTVTIMDPITSDANGYGAKAAPASGVNNFIVGIALASGVAGNLIPVLLNPGIMQGH
jgi:hypothetical protein